MLTWLKDSAWRLVPAQVPIYRSGARLLSLGCVRCFAVCLNSPVLFLRPSDVSVWEVDTHGTLLRMVSQNVTTIFGSDTQFTFTGLSMESGRRYASCVRVVNLAGVPSDTTCSNGVLVGKSATSLLSDEDTSILLSAAPESRLAVLIP